jgi:hypothetical protein
MGVTLGEQGISADVDAAARAARDVFEGATAPAR